jgi:hypothetical protein
MENLHLHILSGKKALCKVVNCRGLPDLITGIKQVSKPDIFARA